MRARGLEGGCRGSALENFFFLQWDHIFFCLRTALYLGGFSTHGFFVDGFLFPVKELGFWNNPGHWVRVLNSDGPYMYFLL